MEKRAVILMTALVPTIGHEYLIAFASEFMDSIDPDGFVNVIVSGRSFEPIDIVDRVNALDAMCERRGLNNVFIDIHFDDKAPQQPDGTDDDAAFWKYWVDVATEDRWNVGQPTGVDFIFASEMYGKTLAEKIGASCTFIPVDINRTTYEAKSTTARKEMVYGIEHVLPEFRPHITQRIVLFGADSTGKSTLSRRLATLLKGKWLVEWARPFLEAVGTEVTEDKMMLIARGQYAMQQAVLRDINRTSLYIFQDTDLLTTVGYWRLYYGKCPEVVEQLAREHLQNTLYVLTSDRIPFTPDPLRYGGNRRESDNQFWINILEEFGAKWIELSNGTPSSQLGDALPAINNHINETLRSIMDFKRD